MNDVNSLSHTKWNCNYPIVIAPKVSQKDVLWRETARDRRNIKNTVQLEEEKDSRSRGVPRPCAYVGRDTSESGGAQLHGILKREKQPDDL